MILEVGRRCQEPEVSGESGEAFMLVGRVFRFRWGFEAFASICVQRGESSGMLNQVQAHSFQSPSPASYTVKNEPETTPTVFDVAFKLSSCFFMMVAVVLSKSHLGFGMLVGVLRWCTEKKFHAPQRDVFIQSVWHARGVLMLVSVVSTLPSRLTSISMFLRIPVEVGTEIGCGVDTPFLR